MYINNWESEKKKKETLKACLSGYILVFVININVFIQAMCFI